MHLQSIVALTTSPVAETERKRLRLKEIRARQQQLMAEAPKIAESAENATKSLDPPSAGGATKKPSKHGVCPASVPFVPDSPASQDFCSRSTWTTGAYWQPRARTRPRHTLEDEVDLAAFCRYDDLSMGAALCARDRQAVPAIPETHHGFVSNRRDVRACRRGLALSLPGR